MADLPFVLVAHTLPAGWLSLLEGRCRALLGPWDATRQAEADGLFALLTSPVREAVLEKAPRLRVVSNMAAGEAR